jgi:hypothetical protein
MPFRFDPSQEIREQLEAFAAHLTARDPELAAILEEALTQLSPLPPSGPQRNAARTTANSTVVRQLDGRDPTEVRPV